MAALAGSLAAALGEMMAGVTEGRAEIRAVDSQVREIHTRADGCEEALRNLVQQDTAAFSL